MKKIILLLISLFISSYVYAPNNIEKEKKMDAIYQHQLVIKKIQEYKKEQLILFLHAIGDYESGNNSEIWNKYGYIGKYQFGKLARKSTGFSHIQYSDFRKNPSIWPEEEQDIAMIRLMLKNQNHLIDIIYKCNKGKIIKGVKVTKSGVLAAAHLAGASNVKKYFNTNGRYNPKDANGTSLERYLLFFSGYYF